MLYLRTLRRSALLMLALVGAVLISTGCFTGRTTRDIDRTPVVDTGVGATIIYPGQGAPSMRLPSGTPAPPGASPGPESTAPPAGSGAAPSVGGPAGGAPMTTIGGASVDEKRHIQYREDPPWFKYAALPFALIAAPFKAVASAVKDDPESGPEVPDTQPERPAATPPAPRLDYESTRMSDMERELDQRMASSGAAPRPPAPSASGTPSNPPATGPSSSIADELAALQRAPLTPRAGRPEVARPLERSVEREEPRVARGARDIADGIADRDGDGAIDLWIYRENGEVVRKALDENFDGRPDRTIHYDRTSHEISGVEDDTDHDGSVDSWTTYRNGSVARRRFDGDADGQVDTWTFYRDGEMARHEQDTTGDGFRDRIGHYAEGSLVREERDTNGDGVYDVTLHYDANERVVRRDEDTDLDGRVDMISHYEAGRLARRELIESPDPVPPRATH